MDKMKWDHKVNGGFLCPQTSKCVINAGLDSSLLTWKLALPPVTSPMVHLVIQHTPKYLLRLKLGEEQLVCPAVIFLFTF